jgi:hypothetical protein
MKKIGVYTAKGTVDSGTVERLHLYDGSFKTAYKIVSIKCAVSDLSSAAEAYLVVSTEPTGRSADIWDWGDNTELGWAYFKTSLGANEGGVFYNNVDKDNLIVEDLHIQSLTDATPTYINYEIELEKYAITDSQGALAMVRNRSQA